MPTSIQTTVDYGLGEQLSTFAIVGDFCQFLQLLRTLQAFFFKVTIALRKVYCCMLGPSSKPDYGIFRVTSGGEEINHNHVMSATN